MVKSFITLPHISWPMMTFFYNIGISAYTFAIRVAALFNEKAALWIKGRKGIWEKIRQINRGRERLVWFHAASLGEFEQGRPVMEALKKEEPATRILLTFFSPSGYEIRKNYAGADYILYLPSDSATHARKWVRMLRPDAAVFIKYEFWYHYLHELHQHQIPVYLISAIFRKDQPFFKKWGGLHRRMLHYFNKLFVQDTESVELLSSIGIKNIRLTGDTRFDRVKQIADTAQQLNKIEEFLHDAPAVVCGSTWPPDEDALITYINQDSSPFKWIIAPHEIGENHIKGILEKCHKTTVRYTDGNADLAHAQVLIIDCIGLLSAIYRYGKIAYIGGGFGTGIHNTLEAAVYGIPVIFGPRYQKFKEAVCLLQQGGGFCIHSAQELNELLDTLIQQPSVTEAAGQKALAYVNSQLGATTLIMESLKQ